MVFDQKVVTSFLRVIYLATYWLCTWIVLQKHGARDTILAICQWLEQVLQEYFSQTHGRRLVFRLDTTRL
jgi:hypothetical protein